MPIFLSAQNIAKNYGGRQLFADLSFAIQDSDRIGLIGPNGAGKSTLLRILSGQSDVDSGQITKIKNLRLGFLAQTPKISEHLSIRDCLLQAGRDASDPTLSVRVEELISRFEFADANAEAGKLSGGWKKRLALACELCKEPQVLLLDEPTNHLDVEAIRWLEDFLQNAPFALMTVTHDRLFLQRVATRIFDLDPRLPRGFLQVVGAYTDYVEAKELEIAAQIRHEQVAKNQMAREKEWLARGPQARQTKQKARIERAGELQEQVFSLRSKNLVRKARIDFQEAKRNPKKLIEAQGLSKSFSGKIIFSDLDLLLGPDSRLGILGANGAGKSTLIQVLLGKLIPDPSPSTILNFADDLKVAYFEQHRDGLNLDLSLSKAICEDGDYVQFRGQPVYVRSYLSRFLFRPEQMEMPLSKLSGGEQARLRIAQLMLQPANVLVLDEPTNDLDMDTLDVLEEQLREFQGAVILVSHDRYFLNQVANQILALEKDDAGNPSLQKFASYSQWEEWSLERSKPQIKNANKNPVVANSAPAKSRSGAKISFKDKFEYEQMEKRILEVETALGQMQEQVLQTDRPPTELAELYKKIATAETEIERLYTRWAELESLFFQE